MATYYSQDTGNWSTLANWNSAANGSGSSPASIAAMDDQTFIIQAGHVITFDVEDSLDCDGSVSGWTTGINGITITGADAGNTPGELTLTRTANSASNRLYGLRLKAGATIVGTNKTVFGKLTAGTSDNPIPPEATHVIWALGINETVTIDLTYLSLAMYGSSPIEPVYVLTTDATIGQTELLCKGLRNNTNPNMETEWRAGWMVIVSNDGYPINTEYLYLATIPVENNVIRLASGLTKARLAGTNIVLCRRNIELRATGVGCLIRYGFNAIYNSVALSHTDYGLNRYMIRGGSWHILEGTTIIIRTYWGIRQSNYLTVTGQTVFTGCGGAIIQGNNGIIENNTAIIGCNWAFHSTYNMIVRGQVKISGCSDSALYGVGSTPIINTLICKNTIISGVNKVATVATTTSSIWLYDVDIVNYVTLINQPLQKNITTIFATPRTEIWPKGYEPAGTNTNDRKYPLPIPI